MNNSVVNFWQINLQHSKAAWSHLVSETSEVGKLYSLPIIIIQEPYHYKGRTLSFMNYNISCSSTQFRSCIAVPRGVQFARLAEMCTGDLEVVEVYTNDDKVPKVLVVSGYLDIEDDTLSLDRLEKCVEKANGSRTPILFGLDTNAHSELWNSPGSNPRGNKMEDFIMQHSLVLHNQGSQCTFETVRGKSIIDITLSCMGLSNYISNWRVNLEHQMSDHKRIEFDLNLRVSDKISVRNLNKTDWVLFKNILGKITRTYNDSWSKNKLERESIELENDLNRALDVACPVLEVHASSNRQPKWWSRKLDQLKVLVRNSYRKYQRTKQDCDLDTFRSNRRKYKKEIKSSKKDTWRNFCSSIGNSTTLSKLIKITKRERVQKVGQLLKPDNSYTIDNEDTIELLFETHFSGAIQPERCNDKCERFTNNLEFSYITEHKVEKALKTFGALKAAGPDGFKPIVLQNLTKNFYKRISILYRACLTLGYNPRRWCESKVIMIPKTGKDNYDQPKSFRPISLCSFLLKGLERVVQWHLDETILKQNPIHQSQHAYRRGKGTDTCISKVVDKIESQILRGGYSLGVFLDCSGAFNKVKIQSLIKGMERKNLPREIINWYEAYLKNQLVTIELNGISITKLLTRGIPQGGVLSPICWNIFLEELLLQINNTQSPSEATAYADDLALIINGIHPNSMVDIMQGTINKVVKWGKENDLIFNPNKTEVIMFHNTRAKRFKNIHIDDQMVEYTNEVKYLGVILTNKLNWTKHIESRVKKCKKLLYMLKTVAGSTWGLSPKMQRMTYVMFVRPVLTYACHVWARDFTNKIKNDLQKLNRLACLSIAPVRRSTPTLGLEVIYDLLPLDLHIKQLALNTMKRILPMTSSKWDGIGKNKNGHIKFWTKELDKLGLITECNDKIIPDRLGNKNFEILDFETHGNDAEESYNNIYVYTDGSKIDGLAGYGLILKRNKKSFYRNKGHLGKLTTVFMAEVKAILEATERLKYRKNEKIIFRIDSQSAILAINNDLISSKLVQNCLTKLNLLGRKNKVILQWIKAHVGHAGNELADELAKEGAKNVVYGPEPFLGFPEKYKTNLIKDHIYAIWSKRWKNTTTCRQTKLFFPEINDKLSKSFGKIKRDELGKMVSFITGHCNMNRHLNLIDPSHDLNCRLCGEEEETPEHVLTSCPSLISRRLDIFQAPLLFSPTKWSFMQLARYLRVASIATLLDHQ